MAKIEIIDTHLHYSDDEAPCWKELTFMRGSFTEVCDVVRASGASRLVFACPFSAADSPTCAGRA